MNAVVLKNLRRKGVRSVVILLVAALASGLIFGASTILLAVERSLENGIEKLGADIMAVPTGYEAAGRKILLAGEPTSFYMDSKNLEAIRTRKGVKKVSPQLFMISARLSCCATPAVLLVGYDPASDFTIAPWIGEHAAQWKEFESFPPVTLGYSRSFATPRDMRFYGSKFKIDSILQYTGLGFLDTSVFMTMDAARDMIKASKTMAVMPLNIASDQISSILVKVDREYDVHKVAEDIETSLPGVKAIVTKDFITATRKDVEWTIWGVLAVGALCWVTTLFLTGFAFSMTVNERQRELGILRAMGASKQHVFRLIVSEAAVLSTAGGIFGVALSWAVLLNFKKLIIASLGNIQFLWPSSVIICSLGLVSIILMLFSGAVSAMYPAMKACLKQPYDAIHQGA